MSDSRIINVGGIGVGILGLDRVIAEMAQEFAERGDEEVAAEMLTRLGPRNYFASRFLDEYGEAFVREFRRYLGQPHRPEPPREPEVKLPGMNCCCPTK